MMMEKYTRRLTKEILIGCLIVVVVMLTADVTQAGIPARINYQGRLTDTSTGKAMPGQHDMTFRIYSEATGGDLMWEETRTVTADSQGVFSVLLGWVTPVDAAFDGAAWLELEVGGEILSPRRELASVPFAFRAANADSLDGISPDSISLVGHTHDEYVGKGEVASITAAMIAAGEITDDEISGTADIDPSKVAGTAWTSTNDGAGSGLDADMVDGMHADAFSDSGHIHDDRYYTEAELHVPGTLNAETNPVDWTKLKNLPAGFLDGIDDVGGAGDGHSLDAADGSPVDAVFVNNAGNVGIRKTNPGATLDVAGDINTDTYYSLGGKPVLASEVGSHFLLGIGAGGDNSGGGVTFMGDSAGYHNQGWYNTFVGERAGYSNTTGGFNTMIGVYAGQVNTIGGRNTYIGHLVAAQADTATRNTYVGTFAGHLSRGAHNTFIGYSAGYDADGHGNTAVGSNAGYSNETGSGNIFIGNAAGYHETGSNKLYIASGPDSEDVFVYGEIQHPALCPRIGIGTTNPRSMLTINDNIRGFYPSVPMLTIGDYQGNAGIAMGSDSQGFGEIIWVEYYNHLNIGSTGDIVFALGDLITVDFVMDEDGHFGVGTEDPQWDIHVAGDNPRILVEARKGNPELNLRTAGDTFGTQWAVYKDSTSGDLRFYQGADKLVIQNSTGNVGIGTTNPGTCKLFVNGGASGTGVWGSCSDIRFKDNIVPIGDALGKILSLRGVAFDWKREEHPEKNFDEGTHFGVIAQEIEKVLPEVVRVGSEGDKAVAYSEIVPVLIESIKSQQSQIEELRSEVRELRAALMKE